MQHPVGEPDSRVGELLDEFFVAAQEGRPLDREAFIAEHPDVADELRLALAGFDFIERTDDSLGAPSVQPGRDVPAETLGDFRLVREVGRGGMGVVYEAEQMSLGRRVALKVLPFAAVLDDRQLQRFKHEAQSAALLHHTNIVPVYAVGTERGVHYYAMQLVEGRTLADVISELRAAAPTQVARGGSSSARRAKNRRPSPRAAHEATADSPSSAEAQALTPSGSNQTPDYCRAIARLGVQAAEGLDHAHENGVVHRDIKPANLMVDARGHLWIADFGLARSRTNPGMTMTGAIVGTVRYMSPEQALAKRVPLDHRTDVYSLGVTLLEALTLEPAFPGDDAHRVMQDIAFRAPASPHRLNPAVPPALETILLKAAAKDPELRYSTAGEMAADLRRYLDDKPVLARRPPVIDRMTLWARRHRAAVVAGAAVLVVAVVALAVSTVQIAAKQKTTDAALAQSKRDEQRAEDALEESKRSAARAEANFGKALDAVDRMLSRVGNERLKGVPGLEPVRRKLLEDAVAFYREFLEEEAASDRVGIETARAYDRVAQLCRQLGDAPGALTAVGDGESILRTLAPADGSWSPVLHDLVHAELLRGRIFADTFRKSEAVAAFERAQALAERNLRERPDDPHFATCVAIVELDRGTQLMDLCRFPDSEAALNSALVRVESRIAQAPDDAKARAVRAQVEYSLGELLFSLGRPVDGEALAKKALSHCEPDDTDLRADLLDRLGATVAGFGRFDEALAFLRDAVALRNKVAAESARFPGPAAEAAASCASLARVLRQAGRDEEAKAAHADAVRRHERFLAEFDGVAEAREETVSVLLGLASLLEGTDRRAEAEPMYGKAIALRRAIVSDAPDDLAAVERLADTLGEVGDRDGLDPKSAAALLQDSVNVRNTLIDRCPDVARYRSDQESLLGNLGTALDLSGDRTGALAAHRRAVRMIRELALQTPGRTAYRNHLAMHLLNLGDLERRLGELDAADVSLRESVTRLEGLLAETSKDPEVQAALGAALANLSLVEKQQRRFIEADATARRALTHREDLVRRLPRSRLHRRYLAMTVMNLANLLFETGQAAESEPYWERAAEIRRELAAEDPADLDSRNREGGALLRIIEIRRSAGRVAETEKPLRGLVRVATELAEATPTLASRKDLIQRHHDLAMHLRATAREEESAQVMRAVVGLVEEWAKADPAEYRDLLGSALWNLGVWYTTSRRDIDAVAVYERLIVHDPARYDAYHNLVSQLADATDPALRSRARAVELARRAVDVSVEPDHARQARALLGFALVCNGEWKDGIASYAKAAEMSNGAFEGVEYGSDLAYVALAHARLGELEEARKWFADVEKFVGEMLPESDLDRERILRRRKEVAELLGMPGGK